MKSKAREIILLPLVLLIIFSSGCVAAPKHKVVGGVDKAIGQSEEVVVTPIPAGELSEETPGMIDTVIKGQSHSLTISADVIAPDMAEVYTARLISPTVDETQMKAIVSLFFGEDINNSVYDASYEQYTLFSSAQPANSDGSIPPDKTFAGISYGRLEYLNVSLYTSKHYESYYFDDYANPSDLNCSMTKDQAIAALEELYSQLSEIVDIGEPAIIAMSSGNDNKTNLGSWAIDFCPEFNGIPFVPSYCLPSGGYSPTAEICMGDEGIISIYGRIMFDSTGEKKIDILSLTQILSIIPDKLGTEIFISDKDVIKQISLRYIVDWDDSQMEGELIPVWFFSVEKLPTGSDTEFPAIPNYATINLNSSSNSYFMMDAITGEILG